MLRLRGPCQTPNEKPASGGLRYTRLHTTALCSPARAGAGPPSPIYLAAESARLSDWISVLLRQGPQLFQGETATAAGFGNQHPGPYALGARGLTGLSGAPPAAGTLSTQRLGALVGNRRPPVRIPRTHDRYERRAVDLHPVRLPESTVTPNCRTWQQPLMARVGGSVTHGQYGRIVEAIQTYCRPRLIRGPFTWVYE